MYAIPLAAPRAMPDLVSQFNGVLPDPLFPAVETKCNKKQNQHYRSHLYLSLNESQQDPMIHGNHAKANI